MENFESQQYRDELAKEIKEVPKEDRKDVLENAKENPDYWRARTEKIKEQQDEEEIDDGLGILVKKKTLYHGSGISGIKKFDKAEDDTVGSGVYFTSEAKHAIGYARNRSERELTRQDGHANKDSKPVIYEVSVENLKLLDIRYNKNLGKIMKKFSKFLWERAKEVKKLRDEAVNESERYKWNRYRNDMFDAIEAIDSGRINTDIQSATRILGQKFSDFIKSLGYDGLVTFEGGEKNTGGNHDTYVIFDPEKVKMNQEHNINIE